MTVPVLQGENIRYVLYKFYRGNTIVERFPLGSRVGMGRIFLCEFGTGRVIADYGGSAEASLFFEDEGRKLLCFDELQAEIDEASKTTAIVRSANMSLGVNVLLRLVQEAAKKLAAEGFDIEIVEKHHHFKKDAPSGTALAIADAINEALPEALPYVYDRSGRSEPRPKSEIGISAVRGGTIVGEHEIMFCGTDEVITLSHMAYSKAIFGKGAVVAAKYVAGKGPGLYTMKDVID